MVINPRSSLIIFRTAYPCSIIFFNHNCNEIVKSDWLSTALISASIGQFNRTVRAITRALKWLFFSLLAKQNFEFLVF